MAGAPTAASPPPGVVERLAPLVVDPATTAVITDYDGTLAPIVDDPELAVPLAGAPDLLVRLAGKYAVVAVVSGRSVAFLREHLGRCDPVRLVGLYGLEWSRPGGGVVPEPGAERWRPVIADAAARLSAGAPPGVEVERKGLAVTVHWRRAPLAADWVAGEVGSVAARGGLRAHPGRMSVELRAPSEMDKGAATRRLVEGCTAACFVGDDLGDLPAFAALHALAAETGLAAVAVAVTDAESAPEVAAAADVAVPGPPGALSLLGWLADGAWTDTTPVTG